jgi:hypothetical protein
MPRISCPNCSREYDPASSICPGCSHDRTAPFQAFAPSIVMDGPDPESGEHTIKVFDPSGVHSVVRRGADGLLSVSVRGATGIGRPGETRAAHTLWHRLRRDGHLVEVRGGDDPGGIDRSLIVNGEAMTLQVTVVPQVSNFWQDARKSSGTIYVTQADMVVWLRDAVLSKADTAGTHTEPVLLAIDARHAGLAAVPGVIQQYLALFGSPAREFHFASVWVVGPTEDYCLRIGEGRP